MAYRLGIDLGESLTLAAYLFEGEVRLLPLDDNAAALPTMAHNRSTGGVVVGAEALAVRAADPEGVIEAPLDLLARNTQTEINGQRVTGEVIAARILETVLAKAVARFGSRPERTVVAHPATWSGTSTANLMAAANRAGLQNVSLIPADEAEIIATTVAGENSGIAEAYLGAYGASVLASKALDDGLELTQPVPMPLVTREDIEGTLPEAPKPDSVIESIYEPKGPSTVFTEEDEPAPRPVATPAQTAPTPSVPRPQPTPAPPDRTGWYAAIGLAAVAVVALSAYLLFFVDGGDSDEDANVAVEGAPTTTLASTIPPTTQTTVATTTIVPTTLAPTTVAPTTVPTTTVPPTTVTTLPVLARPGLVALTGRGLILEPGTGAESNVLFGFDADAALDRITTVAGAPDSDSGWIADEFCSAPEVRVVNIGDLEVIFAGTEADGSGPRSFEQWFVAGDDRRRPENLVARLGAGVGVTLADMGATYGAGFTLATAGGEGFFQLDDSGPISGRTTGLEPEDSIATLSAGLTCDVSS